MMVAARPQRAAQTTPLLSISMLLVVTVAGAGASTVASVMPMAFAGGDLVANLKEVGEAPVRTVSCVGAQGSGKSTLMKTMFGQGASNLALLEARSSAAFVPETNEVEVGAGQAMVSLAVSDATIYNVLVHDLRRPDALSDVQPALEELLTLYEDGVVDPEQPKTFVVAVRDCEDGDEAELEKRVGERLQAIWAAAVKPEGFAGSALSDVLDVKVFTLPHHSFASDEYLLGAGLLKNSVMDGAAGTPAVEVARLLQQVSSYAGPATESVGSNALTASFISSSAAVKCMASFKSLVGRMGAGFEELNTDFGELCDGVIDTVLQEYDEAVDGVSGASGVLSRKKAELKRHCLRELGLRHADQVDLLRTAARAKFDETLSGLRVSPDVGKQMMDAIQEADKFFAKTVRGMNSRHGSWPSNSVRKELRDEMREFASERLQLVQAQGGMVRMQKRKPVGMAFHWFLPKPFGQQARESRLDLTDPMRYTYKANQASPMFMELLCPSAQEVSLPSEGIEETEIHKDVKQLQKVSQILVRRHDERLTKAPDVFVDGTTRGDPEKIKREFYRGDD
ncbi:RHD3b, RHD3/Sey1 family GTPase involved in the ER-to-Golgi traffic [Ectocarpus siliculosus]|uniref:RHD3b, RHD3/Sey1 family GTPase involved in the ER-to-Golgi traffic n=1 Tax=Ectocarpus siliculosus TaxID=2880 RepID=D7FSH8_ECTSI|nr:RHD3b, RHD3/Sey1 family GTPase involved in the ER-to-Golgi traffic [Ectocarpus siliculosus]|eukprot:CBJ31119.1 RHD3b, RHD3/Sey1 family GTPase involved in the ER-to-Golgi traffic [Ectocarpus siliculosus]